MKTHIKQSYWRYLIENFTFMSTISFDMIPQLLGIIYLNFAGDQELIGLLGFLISSFYFFCCLFFNHSEVINLKSGAHFSVGDFTQFTQNILQCIMVNLLFYCVSILICLQCKSIFILVGLSGEFLELTSYYLPYYCLCIGSLFMLTNIIRGKWRY